MQGMDVEITEYEPFNSIAWSLKFDQLRKLNKNTTYIQTTVLINCTLIAERDYTMLEMDMNYEMQTTWWLKLIFRILIKIFHSRVYKGLADIKADIEKIFD